MNEWFTCQDNKGGCWIQSPRRVIKPRNIKVFSQFKDKHELWHIVWAVPQARISAVSETVMQCLAKKPKKTELALHKGERLHNRACNTWSNKPVIDAYQTMEWKGSWDCDPVVFRSFFWERPDVVSTSPSGNRVLFGKPCFILQLMGNKLSKHVLLSNWGIP